MKKALCFFMAIVFVCCVISHGKNERFSVEAMITNLTNFEDIPTFEDVAECWRSPYEWAEDTYFLPRADLCVIQPVWEVQKQADGTNLMVLVSPGLYLEDMPVALDRFGNDISDQYPGLVVSYRQYYNPETNQFQLFEYAGRLYDCLPYLEGAKVLYERNQTNEVLQFFENIKGFFRRLSNTISIIFEMLVCVFDNVQYLLPWNNTVPRGQW